MSNLDTVPGESATYANQTTFGIATSRRIVVVTPKYGGQFKAGEIIRMEIPNQDYIDPTALFMTFRSELFAGSGNSWITSAASAGAATPLVSTSGLPYLHENRMYSSDVNCMKHVRFLPGIQCLFSRIRILAGSTTIEDIQDYSDLYRFMLEATTSSEWRNTDGLEQEAFYDPENPEHIIKVANHHSAYVGLKDDAATTYPSKQHVYTVRPMLGLLSIGKLIPVKYMGNLVIEFYLAENEECLWSTSSVSCSTKVDITPILAEVLVGKVRMPTFGCTLTASTVVDVSAPMTALNQLAYANTVSGEQKDGRVVTDFPNAYYQLSQVELHVPFVTVMESYDKALMDKIEGSGLDLHFSTFHEHTRQLNSVGRQTLTFTERSLSVKGGFMVMRNSDDIRDIRSDVCFYGNNIDWYQWKIGNEFHPPQRIECSQGGARPLAYLKMALGTFSEFGESNNIKVADYLPYVLAPTGHSQDHGELRRGCSQPSKFAIGLNLEKSPGQLSGFDSAAAGVDIELWLELATQSSRFTTISTAANPHSGEFSGKLWQPSKYKVYPTSTPYHESATNTAFKNGVVEYFGAQGNRRFHNLAGVMSLQPGEPGMMLSKDLSYHPERTLATDLLVASMVPKITVIADLGSTGKYTRVQFYAHVDALLKIQRVGQIKVSI